MFGARTFDLHFVRLLLIFLIFCLSWHSPATTTAQTATGSDLESIQAALKDYIQGSTRGQPERLKRVFLPGLNLYSIRNGNLSIWSGKDYISSTKQGQSTGETGKILSVDYENDIAIAKVEIRPQQGAAFVDYFMLLKIQGAWKIVHKMYTRRNGKAGSFEFSAGEEASSQKEAKEQAGSPLGIKVEDQIDHVLSEYDGLHIPGVAVGIVKNGRVVYQKAFGAANVEHQVPIVPEKTLFNIGSTSKHFTGFAIALLAERGRLSLDDDVRKYIPELPDLGQQITLRHLANHTSGIRSELSLLALAGWTPGDIIRKRHIMRALTRQQGLNFAPGDEFEYSNSGFTLLAEVVSRVAEKPFHDFCRDELFASTEMKDTRFSSGQTEFRPFMAYCYSSDSAGVFPRNPGDEYAGSTGVWTTCVDFTKWAANFQSRKFGSQQVWNEMLEPGQLNNGTSIDYSLGLFHEKYNGRTMVHHGGATSGYVANLAHFPEDHLTIALMANTSTVNARDLTLEIADLFLEPQDSTDVQTILAPKAAVTGEQLQRYVGRYWNQKDRTAEFRIQGGSLVYAIDSGPTLSLRSAGEHQFVIEGVSGPAQLFFEETTEGKFKVKIPRNDGQVSELVPYEVVTATPARRNKYVGKYYSEELDTIYTIRKTDLHLFVDHPRFQNVELIPVTDGVYRNNSWRFTTLHFQSSPEDQVTGFTVHALRNRNIKFRKLASLQPVIQDTTPTHDNSLTFDEVDSTATAMLEQQHLPGLAVVVVKDGRTVFKKGYGIANLETNTKVDPDTSLFRIGSVSKALTFLTLAKLIDKGLVKRSDPVDKFVNQIQNPRAFSNPVTVNDLLQHTGGFDQIGTGRHVFEHHLSLEERLAKRVGIVNFLESNNLRRVTDAGEMFRYDTYGVTLAGAIIEKVTGLPFAEAMKQEMFETLGMRDSFVEVEDSHRGRLAIGYGWQQNVFQRRPYEVYVTTPASSIDMTPADMGRLLEALTNEGANASGRFLSQLMTQQVLAPQFRTHPEFVGITHGLFESYSSYESNSEIHLRTVGHGGNMDGYRCAMTIIPEKKVGVFVVTNRSPESGGGNVDFRPVLDLVINQFKDGPKFNKFSIPPDAGERLTESELDEYTGQFYYGIFCHQPTRDDMARGAWRRRNPRLVTSESNGLRIGDESYVPYKKDVFVKADGERLVHFGRDRQGRITNFVYSTSCDTFEKEMPELPYPRFESLAQQVVNVAASNGNTAALQYLSKHLDSSRYYIREDEFNNAGYHLLQQRAYELAIEVFKVNTREFPDSWNAFDSLAEAYAEAGMKDLAIENYLESLRLNPKNEAGRQRMNELREH